jgi:hypothetical protein
VRSKNAVVDLSVQAKSTRAANFVFVSYTVVWVLEGALRKWVPGTESLMYLGRDAAFLVTLLMFAAVAAPLRRTRWWPAAWAFLLVLTLMAGLSVIAEQQVLSTAVVGLRAYALPVLFAAFAARYVSIAVIRPLSTAVSWLVMGNLALVVLQVLSPSDALINRQVGGDEATFINAGVVRASGTFSSPLGLTLFVTLAVAVVLAAVIDGTRPRVLHLLGVVAALSIVAVGGSRGAVLGAGVVVVAAAVVLILRGSFRSLLAMTGIAALVIGVLFYLQVALPQVLESFATRVDQASREEDSQSRVVRALLGFVAEPFPLFGDGPGSHTSAAAQLTGADWVETESLRWTQELGWLGFALGCARIVVCVALILRVLATVGRGPALLPLVVAAFVPVLLVGSVTQQPSTQGFAAVSIGLLIVLLRSPENGPTAIVGNKPPRDEECLEAGPQGRVDHDWSNRRWK